MTILRGKLAANQRRLKRTDRLKALAAHGIHASALGVTAHEQAVAALRSATPLSALTPVAALDIAQKLKTFGTGDLLMLMDWNVENQPGFVVSRQALADAAARNPRVFGLDGFIVIDGAIARAVFFDIDENGGFSCQEMALSMFQEDHASN